MFLCINLDRAPERRAAMLAEAQRIDIELQFVQAVDGRNLDLDEAKGYDREGRLRYAPDLRPNEVACVLSHRKALETFLASNASIAVILEDDAVLSEQLPSFVDEAKALPLAWDAINLERRKGKPLPAPLAKFDSGIALHASPFLSSGAAGWMYSRQGANKIVDSLDSFRHGYDEHLGFFWRHRFVVMCVCPSLVQQGNAPSTIGPRRLFRSKDLTARQWLRARGERIEHSIRKRIGAHMLARQLQA